MRAATSPIEKERPLSQPVHVPSTSSGVMQKQDGVSSQTTPTGKGPKRSSLQTEAETKRLSATLPSTPTSGTKISRRSRSKSPFRSFRWKRGPSKGDESFESEERPSPGGVEEGVIEGTLTRKHEWETMTKKATNRSWDKVYCVAKNGKLIFFKDQKASRSVPEQTFKGEPALDLQGAAIDVASDYTKKKHVFRIKLSTGGEFLLQSHDDSEMNTWVTTLKQLCEAITGGESRSQTLPASSQKDEPKRRSFFTLKKK